jgi:hypothetical protein
MTVDPKVYELAKAFLADAPDAIDSDVMELAEEIQLTIEGFLEGVEAAAAERAGEPAI